MRMRRRRRCEARGTAGGSEEDVLKVIRNFLLFSLLAEVILLWFSRDPRCRDRGADLHDREGGCEDLRLHLLSSPYFVVFSPASA